jgi:hypothetical protein
MRSPQFNLELWPTSSRVLDMAPSTTNNVEAWHKNLNAESVLKHPSLAKSVDLKQKKSECSQNSLLKLLKGGFRNTGIVRRTISARIVDN